MNRLSLRTKGLIIIILISFVPLMIVGLYNYTSMKKDMVETEIDKIRLKQESRSFVLSSWLDTRKAEVLVMSRTNEVRSGDTSAMMEYLEQEQQLNSFQYEEIGFISEDGIATSLRGSSSQQLSWRLPIARSLRGDTVLTDPITLNDSNERLGYISVPVYSMDESNQLIGALYAAYAFPPAAYEQMLQIEGGNLYLYNHSGELLYDHLQTDFTNQQDTVLRTHLKQLAALALTESTGYKQIDVMLHKYILFYQAIENTDWVIMEVKDLGALEKLAAPTLWRMLLVVSAAIVVLAFVFFLYFQTIISRLEAILQVTKQAAAGHFDGGHLNASNKDEIGVLANTVNGMMGRLQIMFDRLDAVINQNKSPVFVMDERYVITYMNQAAEQMLGYSSDEIIGKVTPLMFMDIDEVRVKAEQFSAELGREIQPGVELFLELRKQYNNYDFELTVINREGKRIPVYNRSSSLRDRNGRISGIIAIFNDITEQRRLESSRNHLQMVVESAKDLIASVDKQANIIYMNAAGRSILGLSEDEVKGLSIRSFLPAHLFRQLLRGSLTARKQGFFECEAQFQNISGKFINVSIIIVAYKDTFTGETLYSCISRDITEQLEVQRKLVRATEVAEEANQAKSTFLALMSHEIRTPLNGIIGLSQLMQKTELDQLQKEYVQHMKDSSSMLLSIVNDILDFSKLEAKKIEPDLVVFQLHTVINYLADQLSVFLGGKEQFEFKIEIEPEVPHHMLGDALRLEQVLSNLCVNAIKFTEHGIVALHIAVAAEREDELDIQFTVKDSGIGMSEEQLKHLFKPFRQADSSTTRKYGGTGLGLVISKNLVELLGGRLEVSSKLHIGSTFTFTLPFKKVGYQLPPEPLKTKYELESIVWIVEDHDVMANYWTKLLASCNYNAVRKRSWKKAYFRLMRLGEGAYPSFMIMDMEMNDMYGMETWLDFQRAAASRGIPIIAVTTAYGREELLILEPEQQPAAILTKPVTQKRFKDAVDLVLHAKQRIPVAKQQPDPDKPQQSASENQIAVAHEPQYHVLLAEDNKVNQLVAAEMLKFCNCRVTIASHGLEAVQLIQSNSYDLVLMDIHMPEMDGVEATKVIRAQKKHYDLPIVAVTANVLPSDHESYLLHGMNAVITKPLSIDQLQLVIDRHVSKNKSENRKSLSDARHARETNVELLKQLEALSSIQAMQAIERVNGKVNIYVHMLEQYLHDYALFIPRLKKLYEDKDYAEVTRALHTLKGASSYLGAEEIVELAIEGERIAREEHACKLSAFIDRLEQKLNLLLFEISNIILKN
ncbi:hypothetical protein J40TS1_36100 [Paenibacillus montaniterrae]|uniref:Circadian input-output histidine kinase CikA n=1 Tax=Paenibacillus montaniterrae TaxID=429341 RepID=A0A919YQ28_9BACL|nr:response regulator [Paenibacillus montaniterrae]GIP17968.1 hypothetical protein J40TS1_36100 [Paenibacillus montaniterrae]